jgi:hypothetical protein
MINLFLEKSLNIFKGRMGDELKIKTESRMMVCFNNYYLIKSSILKTNIDKDKDISAPFVYIPEGRSLNLVYYNKELYNQYGETIGNQDFSKVADDLKKPILFDSLHYNGIEINNTTFWKEINILSGIGFCIRFLGGNKTQAANKLNNVWKFFAIAFIIINFFTKVIMKFFDWVFDQLQIGYNVGNYQDTLFSLELGGIFKIILIKDNELVSTKDIPEIFNIAQKLFFSTGISINFTWFETRLNLQHTKQTFEDYYESKENYSVNFYKPEWNFFGLWQLKYSCFFSGLKEKGLQTELVMFYPHLLDIFSRIIKNSYQGKFIKPASALNLSHGLKTLAM